MSVFGNVPCDRHFASIRDAADALICEARRRCEGRTWSIAELELSDSDVKWLNDWAALLRADQTELTLRHDSRLPSVGLVLLAFAAENLRRDGRERGIYEVFADGPFDDEVRQTLFAASGYPRTQVRQAIEDACRLYGLRHAFDTPTTQPWYLTIKLQFGFTLCSASEQLEHWLVGVPPYGIELLLDGEPQSNAAGTPVRSESFHFLWDSLLKYRGGRLGEREARRAIENSPWTLGEWADHLLPAVRPVHDAGYSYVPVADRPAQHTLIADTEDRDQDEELSICGSVRLRWEKGEIRLTATYEESGLKHLSGDCFVVSVDERQFDVLRRQGDGRYSNLGGDAQLTLPSDRDEVMVSLADENGQTITSQRVRIYDRDEDFQVFAQSGGRVSVKQLVPVRGYTLRLPVGAIFHPDSDLEQRTQIGDSMWVQLRPGWTANASIHLPGDPVAMPILTDKDKPSEDWTGAVQVSTRTIDEGNSFTVSITSPADVALLSLKVSGVEVKYVQQSEGSYRSNAVSGSVLRHDGVAMVRMVVMRQRCRVVSRKIQIDRCGLLIYQNGLWQLHARNQPINTTKLSRTQVSILPGRTDREEQWSLMEGSRRLSYRSAAPRRLNDLGCRGWPLCITDHRYNRTVGAKLIELCCCVIDQGIVGNGVQRPGSKLVELRLLHELEPSADHHCVLWTRSGRLANVGADKIRVDGCNWIVDPAVAAIAYEDSIVAASVAFRGRCQGSWWTDDWWRPITRIREDAAAAEVAACLRWFGLPLMQLKRDVEAVATTFGRVFFQKWCLQSTDGPLVRAERRATNQFLSSDLLRPNEDEADWIPTVRYLLRNWQPTPEDAKAIAPEVWEPQDGQPSPEGTSSLEGIILSLAASLPVITTRFLNAWFSSQDDRNSENGLRYMLSCKLRKDLDERCKVERVRMQNAGIELGYKHPSLPWLPFSKSFVDSLVESAAKLVACESIETLDADNLESAFNSSELRRFVAARMLEPVATRPCVV